MSGRTISNDKMTIDNMAGYVGISVKMMAGLVYAAGRCGVEPESLCWAMCHAQMVSIDSFRPDDRLHMLATEISECQNQAERAALAMAVFGRDGITILPLLAVGREGIERLEREYREREEER